MYCIYVHSPDFGNLELTLFLSILCQQYFVIYVSTYLSRFISFSNVSTDYWSLRIHFPDSTPNTVILLVYTATHVCLRNTHYRYNLLARMFDEVCHSPDFSNIESCLAYRIRLSVNNISLSPYLS